VARTRLEVHGDLRRLDGPERDEGRVQHLLRHLLVQPADVQRALVGLARRHRHAALQFAASSLELWCWNVARKSHQHSSTVRDVSSHINMTLTVLPPSSR